MADDTEATAPSSTEGGAAENASHSSGDAKGRGARKGKPDNSAAAIVPAAAPGARADNRGVSRAQPTLPPPIDPKTGLELDEHGLPTSGPARASWLAERRIADPAVIVADNERKTQDD